MKAATAATVKRFKNLSTLRDRLGDEFIAGIVLTTGVGQPAGDRLLSRALGVVIALSCQQDARARGRRPPTCA